MAESPLERLRRLEAEERKARPARGPSRERSAPDGRAMRRGGVGVVLVAVLVFLATKGKLVLLFLLTKGKLLLGALKLGPLLTTFSTMGLSAWLYAKYYGVWLAIGVVVLILVHEIGHGVAARAMNLRVGAPVFIPFFGAVIALKDRLRSTWQDAVIGYGGPLFGAIGGGVVLLVGLCLRPGDVRDFFLVLAWFTFLLNLFNLTPVWQLDGARITSPIRPWHWLAGCLFLGVVLAFEAERTGRVNPFLLLIAIIGALRGAVAWWKARRGEDEAPGRLVDRLSDREAEYAEEDRVTPRQRHGAAAAYFLLAAGLALLTIYAAEVGPGLHGVG